ncbi:hypothetical protein Hypma_008007 [Hypsizygus marmoreus]|uniref:Zn(2)-C6 fungal-type domain-containing protein n=1 Tax=Hypsizygus marmoreus TaxID=39966 RepID=A0A369JWA7_HYPMA|nr:hypothetical protein Hypma_008007 [Hypsizygus marmoreus]
MNAQRTPVPPSEDQPMEFRKKDGSLSKMRNHRGNIPILPQTKLCPHCPAKFTRTTHLNRHMRTHTNERIHRCDTCESQFTRSDLLTRHKKSCNDPSSRTRRKSCVSCMESKIKCDRQYPCSKCTSRGKECIFTSPKRKPSLANLAIQKLVIQDQPDSLSSDTPSDTSRPSVPSSDATLVYPSPDLFHIQEADPHTQQIVAQDPSSHHSGSLSSSFSLPSVSRSALYPTPDLSGSVSAQGLSSADTDTTYDDDSLVPVHSHLSAVYACDMFEPFFSDIFSKAPMLPIAEDFTWTENGITTSTSEVFPFVSQAGLVQPVLEYHDDGQRFESVPDGPIPESSVFSSPLISLPIFGELQHLPPANEENEMPPEMELQHYLYLFFSAFITQIPIVHGTLFSSERKPPVLLSAMQACGALFVKTRKASIFISKILFSAREALVQEFAKKLTDTCDQMHLILAVVLLQTIGLFHQQPDQRASSSVYHGMLVMMIRQTEMIATSASWVSGNLMEVPLDTLWQRWVVHEMTKRAIWWSYLHDCCHSIYFALPSSYDPSEIELNLPCEEALWRASTSTDWFLALQAASPYGPLESRLTGVSMMQCLAAMSETRLLNPYMPLNPFAHFILIHAILRHLFVTCVEGRQPRAAASGVDHDEIINQEIFRLQYALHNWLQNWLNSPELPKVEDVNEEPPFIHNALPFYWLGQVSLLAFQEGLPPFEQDSPNNSKVEVRFRLVKQWLKHIRGFLKKGDQAPTLFWDELMKMRLQTWQQEFEGDDDSDQDGLLGFFPEH